MIGIIKHKYDYMSVYKGFNLTLTQTIKNLAHYRHEKTKYYKKNDGIRLLQTKPKDAFKSQFCSLF